MRGPNDFVGPGAVLDGETTAADSATGPAAQGSSQTEAPAVRTLTIDAIARACHEANRVYSTVIGDNPREGWDDFPEEERNRVRQGVQHVIDGVSPEELHASWCDAKHQDGWIYGEVKDPVEKTHPCLRPWAELPPEQRAKDLLFRAISASLVPSLP